MTMAKKPKPTLIDIAVACDTSIATVSRALSKPGLVQPDTLERIRTVAASLGYVPNRRARALVSGRSNTVGVAVPTLNSPIFSATLQEMQLLFAAQGYQLLIASHEYDAGNEAAALAQLISHGVDGLIVVGSERPQSTWTMLGASDIPLVQMWEGRDGIDRVTVDNFLAGQLIARHLLDTGHTMFGVICGELRNNDRQQARLAGIRAALADRGLTLGAAQISEQPLSLSAGRAGCVALLDTPAPPTALIGTTDLLAIGAMIEAQGRGLRIPDAMSFAGIDNVDFAAHLSPSLTTIDIPAASIGREAAQTMLRRLAGDVSEPDIAITLPIKLVVRQSTGAVPSAPAIGS